jgi:hypothetical protein
MNGVGEGTHAGALGAVGAVLGVSVGPNAVFAATVVLVGGALLVAPMSGKGRAGRRGDSRRRSGRSRVGFLRCGGR